MSTPRPCFLPRRKARRAGFTLVELLLGIILSMLVLGAAYATFQAASGAWAQSRSRATTYQYGRAALAHLDRTLRSAVPPGDTVPFEHSDLVIEGTELPADRLRFVTTGLRADPSRPGSVDTMEIEYAVEVPEETGLPMLMVRQRAFASDDPEWEPRSAELAARVAAFDVEFYDGVEYLPEWIDTESLPQAVRVSLLLYDFDTEENSIVLRRMITLAGREP